MRRLHSRQRSGVVSQQRLRPRRFDSTVKRVPKLRFEPVSFLSLVSFLIEDQLTEKQIRSYFSRLRPKIKSGINGARSHDIINEKVRNEVIQELQKIQKRMTGSNEIESE